MSLFRGEGDGSVVRREVFSIPISAASVAQWAFIADRPYNLVAVREIHTVAGGAAAAVRVRKVQIDATAPGAAAGANVIELTPSIALTGTANTTQNVAASTPQIAAGDRIGLNFTGTLTALVGTLQLEIEAA